MDSIGDYIYLIILAIAGLSSLLKKKKNTDTATSTSAPAKPKRSWEDILKELTPVQEDDYIEESDEEKSARPEIVAEAPREKVPKPAFFNTFHKKEETNSAKTERNPSHIKSSNISSTVKNEVYPEVTNDEIYSFESVEDARRAFVYSEIFNRKY